MINIRQAKINDIGGFKRIIEESILEFCKDCYSQKEIQALLKQYPGPEVYKKWIGERVLLVAETGAAETGSEIVGFAQFDPATFSIEAVHVAPKYAYLGIGRCLIESIEKEATEMGIHKITLTSSINADRFYAKCGYTRIRTIKFICNNGVELKTIAYEKEI